MKIKIISILLMSTIVFTGCESINVEQNISESKSVAVSSKYRLTVEDKSVTENDDDNSYVMKTKNDYDDKYSFKINKAQYEILEIGHVINIKYDTYTFEAYTIEYSK